MICTSYFSNVPAIQRKLPNVVFIGIAGKTLDGFIKYSPLAPKYEWWKEWHDKFSGHYESKASKEWYTKKYYETVLDKLDPFTVRGDLYKLSSHNDVCMLCYETPEKFCHRHLVAEWLTKNGITVKEVCDDEELRFIPGRYDV